MALGVNRGRVELRYCRLSAQHSSSQLMRYVNVLAGIVHWDFVCFRVSYAVCGIKLFELRHTYTLMLHSDTVHYIYIVHPDGASLQYK